MSATRRRWRVLEVDRVPEMGTPELGSQGGKGQVGKAEVQEFAVGLWVE